MARGTGFGTVERRGSGRFRARLALGESASALAREFNVSRATVYNTRKTAC
jgi:hypothetical protein